jgi:hypothetical protein
MLAKCCHLEETTTLLIQFCFLIGRHICISVDINLKDRIPIAYHYRTFRCSHRYCMFDDSLFMFSLDRSKMKIHILSTMPLCSTTLFAMKR